MIGLIRKISFCIFLAFLLGMFLVPSALADAGHDAIPLDEPQTEQAPVPDEHTGDAPDEAPLVKSATNAEKPHKAPANDKAGSTKEAPVKKLSASEAAGHYQLNTTAANYYFIALGLTVAVAVMFITAVVALKEGNVQ